MLVFRTLCANHPHYITPMLPGRSIKSIHFRCYWGINNVQCICLDKNNNMHLLPNTIAAEVCCIYGIIRIYSKNVQREDLWVYPWEDFENKLREKTNYIISSEAKQSHPHVLSELTIPG